MSWTKRVLRELCRADKLGWDVVGFPMIEGLLPPGNHVILDRKT